MLLRPVESRGPSRAPVLLSALAHMSVLGFVAFSPPAKPKPLTAYQREIAPHERKLVWYRFKEKLPEVSPPKTKAASKPVRATIKNPKQTIVAKSKRPDASKQMLLAPGPQLKVDEELKAPNLMAFELPPPPEARPEPKLFTPPPEPARSAEQPALEAGPALAEVDRSNPLEKLPAPKVPPKEFVPPQVVKRAEAPQLQPGEVRVETSLADQKPLPLMPGLPARPQPKAFTPPPAVARAVKPEPTLSSGPATAPAAAPKANLLAGLPGQGALPARPQPKAFTAPSRRAGSGATAAVPVLESDTAPATNLSAAVVGVNPINSAPVVPQGSRPAEFSAAPEISTKGEGGMGGPDSAGIVMQDLMVRGGGVKKEALPKESIVALTRIDPTSKANLLAAARPPAGRPEPIGALKPLPGSPVRVSSAPDKRLDGRVVYTVAIQMPNVTSYSGSWILWYAEREHGSGEERVILPPEPLRKVDPIYDLSAVEDRVEGKVRLSGIIHGDGYVYGINVLQGVDPRLDNSAMTALRKWEFSPARRDGAPVDVDIVIEIPFRLRPPIHK